MKRIRSPLLLAAMALLAAGLTTLLALQVFLNVAVVTNLLPSTGISLPFFSYGGTALITSLARAADALEGKTGTVITR